MSLQQIDAYQKDFLTPAMVAPIIGVDQQTLRMQARERPDLLGFPVICIGSRVKIPKEAFLRFMRGLTRGEEQNMTAKYPQEKGGRE